jgi:low affinity Fe/Cu permease
LGLIQLQLVVVEQFDQVLMYQGMQEQVQFFQQLQLMVAVAVAVVVTLQVQMLQAYLVDQVVVHLVIVHQL